MLIKIVIDAMHHGKPVKVDTEVSVTPTEVIELYKSAPGIMLELKKAMRQDKVEAKMAKAKQNMNKRSKNVK